MSTPSIAGMETAMMATKMPPNKRFPIASKLEGLGIGNSIKVEEGRIR
jgi:hypothetical protein